MSDVKAELNLSIMPLVEENRALHTEVAALKRALADQSVRLDEFLTAAQKAAVHYVDCEVSQHLMIVDRREALREASRALADKLVGSMEKMAMRVQSPASLGGDFVFRFAFLKVGK